MNTHHKTNMESCPDEIREFLPLLVNDTCPKDKREEIRAFLKKNPACAEELRQFTALSRLIREDAERIPVPSDALLNGIMERVETKEQKASSRFQKWLASLSSRLAEWFPKPAVRYAVAFALLILVFQSVVILHQSKKIATYHTLSGPAAIVPGRISLNIIFNPEARLETIQTFLSKHHGQITGGPGASGVYVVSFPKPENLETFVGKLKERKDLILFAEVRN